VLAQGITAFLSTAPAEKRERRLALLAVVISAVAFMAAAPFAKVPLAPLPAFIPIYESALILNDLITCVLLFSVFGIVRSRALLILASGYLFSALMAVSHMLSFPGLFAPSGLLGAGPQTTAWLYMFWHAGFPICVIAYGLSKRSEERAAPVGPQLALAIGCVVATVVGLTLATTTYQAMLPAIMRGNGYTPIMIFVVSTVWACSVAGLVLLAVRKARSVLDVWLMVVMCAWMFDIALAAVLNGGRYDLGFYAGRIYGLLAASFVLVVMLLEHSALYARLAKAHEMERAAAAALKEAKAIAEAVADFLKDKNAYLKAEVERRSRDLQVIQDVTIMAMASLAETRDNETGNHIRRTQHYLRALAKKLEGHPRFADFLSHETIEMLYKSAPLHDIGKVGIPDAILLKPAKLTAEEFEIMKTHTTLGRDAIVAAEKLLDMPSSFLRHAREIAYYHQEKWDGSGYPEGLAGDAIPVSARLMAVADVYDALISRRVYKPPFPHSKAVEIIKEGRGKHFDPDMVDAFLAIAEEFRAIAERYADSEDEVAVKAREGFAFPRPFSVKNAA
jgi:response regulator RpfG family c-di-GMP phosphodiesterase